MKYHVQPIKKGTIRSQIIPSVGVVWGGRNQQPHSREWGHFAEAEDMRTRSAQQLHVQVSSVLAHVHTEPNFRNTRVQSQHRNWKQPNQAPTVELTDKR